MPLYSLEAIAPHPQKRTIKFSILGLPNSAKGLGGIANFTDGCFLPGEGNLRRRDFDDSNLFQSLKKPSVNTQHQLKKEN